MDGAPPRKPERLFEGRAHLFEGKAHLFEGRAGVYARVKAAELEGASAPEVTMQFEVKGQNYFLRFSTEEGQWFLFRPGRDGVERYAIADDAELPMFGDTIIPFDTDSHTNVN